MSLADTQSGPLRLYLGTATDTTSRGLYSALLDPLTGKLSSLALAAEVAHPSFLAITADRRWLFAGCADEIGLHAFGLQPDDTLRSLGTGSPGEGCTHLALHPGGRMLAVAHYVGGSVSSYPLLPDGSLGDRSTLHRHEGSGPHRERQDAPHPHGVTFSPYGNLVLVPDLGIDQVRVYRVEVETGSLRPHASPAFTVTAGSGPRHAAFSLDGRNVYIVNELANTLTVAAFDVIAGKLRTLQTISTLPAGAESATTAAEVAVHPNDRFVYASNRGHDSITVFARDSEQGTLTWVETLSAGGKTPRHFALTPRGRWLLVACQDSDRITVFRIDDQSGRLLPTGHTLDIPRPTCVLCAP